MRALTCLGLAVLAATALAACGGTAKKEYSRQVRDIGTRSSRAQNDLRASSPESSDDLVRAFRTAKETIDKAADDLAALDVPDDARPAHDKTLAGLRQTSKDIDPILAAARAADLRRLQRLTAAGFPSDKARGLLLEAQQLYRKAGYDVRNAP